MKRISVRLILSLIAYISGLSSAVAERAVLQSELSPDAMFRLAEQYEHGEGVQQSVDEAIRLYCQAFRKGLVNAGYSLGWIYLNGRGVKQDENRAAAWLDVAASNGDRHAEKLLARLNLSPEENARQCILSDGSEFLAPIKSVPDPDQELIKHWVERLAPEYGLQAELVVAVIRAESNFNVKARSLKNAQGLMQLIPATAQRFGVVDVWDPLQNIHGGMAYLQWLINHFNGNVKLALAGYNAGENAVKRYRGVPPYAETQAYVKQVMQYFRQSDA